MKYRASGILPVSIALASLVMLPVRVLGDGCVLPPVAFQKVQIPDQRALIHFGGGNETLVIDTAFRGNGTNFAWIIPVPSVPTVEPATTGLFTTLQVLFQPEIVNEGGLYWLAIFLGLVIAFIMWRTMRRGDSLVGVLAFLLLLLLAIGLLLPSFASASASSSSQQVSVIDRKSVGIYDTVTLKSLDGQALFDWLKRNGFATPTNFIPAIRAYAQEGWYFVASKIRLDAPMQDAANPHPLSLKFQTERPVYPLRLTGIDNEPCRIELFVFGPDRAEIPHFTVERCGAPTYPNEASPYRRRIVGLPICHPLLRSLVEESPVATKLVGLLSTRQMQEDGYITWTPLREKQVTRYSTQGAAEAAADIAVPLLIAGLLGLLYSRWAAESKPTTARRARKISGMLVLAALLSWGPIFLSLPKIQVTVSRNPWHHVMSLHQNILPSALAKYWAEEGAIASGKPAPDVAWVRQQLVPTSDFRREFAGNLQKNLITGELWKEEDSPGNYRLRETPTGIEYLWYGLDGSEYIVPLFQK